ncbi:manganese efflux pump MntP family protein [Acuticoccus sp. M5D2P5]|uniref:manganese efflux pump MntP n=1 Tax=Acuticoccus kalidii TaxID=2910977 RepID=UPI001F400A71|nr:manganese efflux pump MntP family protein [Acuticoccus kalidii]MCF3934921.1 manganese efflux pump MntP family protein [Acuticoccus kalidii]
MSPFGIAVLAVSMSVDAFAVSVGRGASIGRPRIREALRTGLVFGVIEAVTPVLGWAAGVAASRYVEAVDHWIAFLLLAGVGLHMLWNAGRPSETVDRGGNALLILVATAIGTSLDAMAVGVSLAFLDVNIAVIAIAIGLTTFLMSSGGMLVGRLIGDRLGRAAEVIAGIALCGIGAMILVEHLGLIG